jgi:cytochrome c oxidase subunit 2
VEKGRQIYETGGTAGLPCGSCHTLDGSELVGPSFQGIADRAGTRVEGVSAEEYLRQSIAEPDAYVVSGFTNTMPTVFSQTLSEEDIDNVIAFLLTR